MPSDDSAALYGLATPGVRMADRCHVKIYDEVDDSTPDSDEPHRRVGPAYVIYPMVYEPNFHELEYFVPFERGTEALAAMRELMLASLPASVFPMEVRTVGRDEAFLSHSYERDTVVISVSGTPGTDYWPYLRDVDRLLGEFDARVHWGKLHFLTREQLLDRYPRRRATSSNAARARPGRHVPERSPAPAVRLTMKRYIVLLRGINVGGHRRIAMADLRALLTRLGYESPLTHLQSGNVVLSSTQSAKQVQQTIERGLAAEFGDGIEVFVRTRKELADVIARDPLGKIADNPSRYFVTFLSGKPDAAAVQAARGGRRRRRAVRRRRPRDLHVVSHRAARLEVGEAAVREATRRARDGPQLEHRREAARARRRRLGSCR